jgi:hypothetical protein
VTKTNASQLEVIMQNGINGTSEFTYTLIAGGIAETANLPLETLNYSALSNSPDTLRIFWNQMASTNTLKALILKSY